MTQLTSYPHASSQTQDLLEAQLFQLGRLGMGWSRAALAKTLIVPEQTVLDWELGSKPIPPRVLAWITMYIRNGSDEDTLVQDQAA